MNHELIPLSRTPATMTSREIAELTGKRHDHVLRDIGNLLKTQVCNVGFSASSYGATEKYPQGYRMFSLSRPAAMRLLCKYSESAMAAVLARLDASMIEEIIADFDAQDIAPDQFIYVAVERISGRYKIGISKDPVARVRHLSNSHPEGLRMVAIYAAIDGILSERIAHDALSEYRLNGEWFSSDAPVERIAAEIGVSS